MTAYNKLFFGLLYALQKNPVVKFCTITCLILVSAHGLLGWN